MWIFEWTKTVFDDIWEALFVSQITMASMKKYERNNSFDKVSSDGS
jgi:hypothetical protein